MRIKCQFRSETKNLKNLHVHKCGLPITNLLIWKIIKVLQSNRSQPQPAPLELCVNSSDVIGLQTINDQNAKRFLELTMKLKRNLSC